eukprot:TRINITY_DN104458_c0_g1_i1.p1 TRINITY_DN104458_c0_g1~~TRINITY_DN104458_c0_g1_i1.p1  ORF type:complete len:237 (-),score=38.37 TRINITY_DN104458_c0_g1_i1:68-778(-)
MGCGASTSSSSKYAASELSATAEVRNVPPPLKLTPQTYEHSQAPSTPSTTASASAPVATTAGPHRSGPPQPEREFPRGGHQIRGPDGSTPWGRPADPGRPAGSPPLAVLPPLKAPKKEAAAVSSSVVNDDVVEAARQESGRKESAEVVTASSSKRPSAVALMVHDYWKKEDESQARRQLSLNNSGRRIRLPPLKEEDLNATTKSSNPGSIPTTPPGQEDEPIVLDWTKLDRVRAVP